VRSISAAQQKVLDAGVQADFVRVSVKDAGGTFRDLTTYPGFNAVRSVQWGERVDEPHQTFDVELMRELYQLSLSPFVSGSAVNKGFSSSGSGQLLAVGREVKIEVAVVAMDTQPASGDWMEVLRGRIDTVDPASGANVRIGGRGLSGRLAQQYVKQERVYSFAAVAGVAVPLVIWQPQMAVTTSPLIYVLPASRGNGSTPDPGFNKFLKCSQAGTTGTTEPVWTTGAGQVDGTAKWDYVGAPTTAGNPVEQIIQNILDDNKGTGDPTVTLYTPSSPGWAITQFLQQRGFTLDAVRTLALQIGWDLRYKWRSGTAQFEFTLFAPTRSGASVDFTFQAADYGAPTQMLVDISTIRNAWRIIYSDASDLWPDGTPKRKVIEVSDSTSITKYGELWAEIQEDSASQIDSSAEATALVNAALSDCKDPTADLAVPLMRGFPWVELNDFETFKADGVRFDADQSLAVTEYRHAFEAGKPKLATTLAVRGQPTIGAGAWLSNIVHPHLPPKNFPHRMVHFDGTETASLSNGNLVGGAQHQVAKTTDKVQLPKEYEIHVYPTPGTALSSSTLATVTSDLSNFSVKGLIPGKTYCQRVVERYRNQGRTVRMQPGVETTFVAFQANAGHLAEGVEWGRKPLNGGFETSTDPNGPPDHWTASAGTWATDMLLETDGAGVEGADYVRFTDVASSRTLKSELFGATAGEMYRLTAWLKEHSAVSPNGQVQLKFYQADLTLISTPVVLQGQLLGTSWIKYHNACFAPANTKYAQVEVTVQSGATAQGFDVDAIQVERLYCTGVLTWVNSSFPTVNGTTYGAPGGGGGVSSANEVKLALPDDAVIAHLRVHARVAGSNMSYAITVAPDNLLSATLGSGATDASDTTNLLLKSSAALLSLKVVATASASPSSPTDIVVTVGIYQP
jgi:hypothetical protein